MGWAVGWAGRGQAVSGGQEEPARRSSDEAGAGDEEGEGREGQEGSGTRRVQAKAAAPCWPARSGC